MLRNYREFPEFLAKTSASFPLMDETDAYTYTQVRAHAQN
jgi:hypothetical protein